MTVPVAIVTPITPTAAGLRMENSAATELRAEIHRLTAGLATGNEDAFREFHAAYFDRLLRYLIVVTRGDEETARDALQETLIRVVRHARAFDSEDVFWSWLTVLARSAAADAGRKRQRYWKLLTSYASSWMPFWSSPLGESDRSEEQLHILLCEGLNELSPGDRAIVEGKYLQRASVRELAAEFGLTEKAVESRLLRARRQLRKQLCQRLKHEETI